MPKKYPMFSDHNQVTCFNCGSTIGATIVSRSGLNPGNGEFLQHCKVCRMFTCYDITPKARKRKPKSKTHEAAPVL